MTIFLYTLCTFLVCLAAGFAGIKLAPALGLLDIPGGRRQHCTPIPRVGGLAVITSFVVVTIARGFRPPLTGIEMAAVATLAILGLVDDRLELRARWKAMLGLGIAVVLAAATVKSLAPSLVPFFLLGVHVPPVPWVAFGLLVLLFWCIPQAFNLIDGANGLATGFGLVVVATLWAGGVAHPMAAGALMACLVLNWPKARLFLGDCGSLSIGLLLVIYAEKAVLASNPNNLMWLFAYPMVDVLTVMAIRLCNRQPVFGGDRNHFHFQIGDRWPGLSHLSVPLLLALAAMCGSATYLPAQWKVVPYAGLTGLLGMSVYFTWASAFAGRMGSRLPIRPVEPLEERRTPLQAD